MAERHELIRATLAKYALLIDDERFDDWAALFTEDAVFIDGEAEMIGRSAIISMIKGITWTKDIKHFNTNVLITMRVHGAEVTSDFISVKPLNGKFTVNRMGRYFDQMTDDGDTWRFARRKVVCTPVD